MYNAPITWKELPEAELADYLRGLFTIGDETGDGYLQLAEFATLLSLSGLGFCAEMANQVRCCMEQLSLPARAVCIRYSSMLMRTTTVS